MITLARAWVSFIDDAAQLLKFKQWGLVSQQAKEIIPLVYGGIYTKVPMSCEVIGYVDDYEIILEVGGQLHSMHPNYLRQMQGKSFNKLDQKNNILEG